jgi:ankyrin repeat protein
MAITISRLLAVLATALLLHSASVRAGAYDDLIAAANRDDTAAVTALIERGMDVNTVDSQGNTLLMIAARERNKALIDYLLKHKAGVRKVNRFGDSALMLSSLGGDLESVRLLVLANADINPQGWTPLMYAAYNGHAEVAAHLVEKGASIDAQSASGMTALMVAAKNGHFAVADLLINNRADASKKDQSGLTAIDHAAKGRNTRIAEMIERTLRLQ